MRLATWNVNSVAAREPRLLAWLEQVRPDVVALQETKCAADAFPRSVEQLGYEVAAHGDGRWNGVALLSRVGLEDVRRGFPGDPGFPDASTLEPRAVSATCGGVRVWSVYVPNGREPGHEHYAYKLAWLDALRPALAADLEASPLVITGDFNVAPTDTDVWDISVFAHATHVTPPERAALARLRELGLRDVVPRALKYDTPYTYWDYRAGMFHKNLGMRIDLVYASDALADRVTDAYVDREARKGTGPSDHAPVVVDLAD
ncbi:exodeoxyribonuclease-3 [Motilibacter rhizosphaerae]|uniref:Exodeoxyribonuclease-3 n=1 Tax=Motilibacter rhizosphaerae TaxID=598652 RepID=A0A4Q7NV65_9ACTN|nr:exodeoxyribonuclease III [Motilibacter rhizosphaerae]RZS91004.1 exodeoxyribonuclease-3 [Motilibacter rhizosphaerae]